MSYEVYVDVRHYPRHNEDYAEKVQSADRYSWEPHEDPKRLVAATLRRMADELSPESELDADERRVWVAVNNEVQRVRKDFASAPHTRDALLVSLMRLADSLGLGDEFLPGIRSMLASSQPSLRDTWGR